jgi:tetratricopeptide (TPR) repeat protein
LSTLYTEINKKFEAINLAERILKINPNSAMAHFNLGYAFRYVGMLEESELEYNIALALDPGNPRFRSAGFTYESLGKYEKSLKAFDLDRGSSLTLFKSGDIMFSTNRIKESVTYYDALLKQETSGAFHYLALAMKFIVDENYVDAFKAMQKYEIENPLDGEMWFSIARRYGLMGDEKNCARTLERAIEMGYYNYPSILTDIYFNNIRNGENFNRVMLKAKVKHEDFKQKYYQFRSNNPGGF